MNERRPMTAPEAGPLLAGTVALADALTALRARRAVFHSEADLQHALAWEAHQLDPQLAVRLETHPEPNVRLDLLLARPDLRRYTAVEVKYLTAGWTGVVEGERFVLRNHGAQDIRAYDVVKDIERVERFVAGRPGWNGVVMVVSNDPSYWRMPQHGRDTNAAAFRLYEGATLDGVRAWGPNTGAGTRKNRESDIVLRGHYTCYWADYSTLPGRRGVFRVLIIGVSR